jgi:hypothetical protein
MDSFSRWVAAEQAEAAAPGVQGEMAEAQEQVDQAAEAGDLARVEPASADSARGTEKAGDMEVLPDIPPAGECNPESIASLNP